MIPDKQVIIDNDGFKCKIINHTALLSKSSYVPKVGDTVTAIVFVNKIMGKMIEAHGSKIMSTNLTPEQFKYLCKRAATIFKDQ